MLQETKSKIEKLMLNVHKYGPLSWALIYSHVHECHQEINLSSLQMCGFSNCDVIWEILKHAADMFSL